MMIDFEKYWEERLSKDFSLSGVGYGGRGKQFNNWMYKARKEVFLDILKRANLKVTNKEVLDIGCGTGFYIKIYRLLGAKSVTGIDIAKISVDKLKMVFPNYRFLKLDLSSHDLICQKFDVISVFDVLFHIVDEDKFNQAIRNIRKLAKEGSYLFISDTFVRREVKKSPRVHHFKFHSKGEYINSLSKNGFSVEGIYPIFFTLNHPDDIANNLLRKMLSFLWRAVTRFARYELVGYWIGAIMYLIDALLRKILKNGPSTKIMVCKCVK